MTLFLWVIGMISGAIGGLATAFSSSDYSGGIIIGAVTAAVASLALGHVFRGSDSSPVPAFIISVPHSGWLGGLASAILTEAGFWGAFLGCGVGYVAGTTLLTVATLFIFRDNPSEREQQNTTQFGNIARLQEPTPTSALQTNQKYEAITDESLSNAATENLSEKADGFLTKIMKAVCNLIVNVLMALIFLGVLGLIVKLFV